jgi:formylglycine-generating enzyme required for sulfatase activity
VLSLAWLAIAPRVAAQAQVSLGLQVFAAHSTLSLTGAVGTVYLVQYATNLSPSNQWTDRTLLLAQQGGSRWTDPAFPSPRQGFYRAVRVQLPADTNLVFIPPGTFTMGSPANEALRSPDETQHTVRISRGFWMEKYLVTQGDYLKVVGTNPSHFQGDLTLPVESVNWYQATNYCALRTQQERAAGLIPANCAYRLPTESEWEYACRAGTTTAFYLGSSLRSGQANFDGQYEYDVALGEVNNPNGVFLTKPTPVGSYGANPWGLYDMIGNLLEWCQDWYGPYFTGTVTDPQGPVTGTSRVFRGGSWLVNARYCRSAQRAIYNPVDLSSGVGFRVVLALSPP